MALDLFQYQTMLRVLEQAKKPKTFLRNNFFGNVEQSTTEQVMIDVHEGKRRTAVYVKPKHAAKIIDRIGYKTNAYKPPYVKMKTDTTAEDFLKRLPGETVFSPGDSPMARAARRVGEDMIEMSDMIDRLEEYQCAQLIQHGQYNIVGDGISEIIDFGLPPTHQITLTGTSRWSQAQSVPMNNLRAWRRLVIQDSGQTPTDLFVASDVVDAIYENAQVQKHMDVWRMNMGSINPVVDYGAQDSGVTFLGYLAEVGLNIWSYDEFYIDPADGVEKTMIESGKVALLCRNMRSGRHYGAIRDLKANFAVPRFPKSWEEEDPSVRWLMVQSAPMMALHQTQSLLVADVLNGGA